MEYLGQLLSAWVNHVGLTSDQGVCNRVDGVSKKKLVAVSLFIV